MNHTRRDKSKDDPVGLQPAVTQRWLMCYNPMSLKWEILLSRGPDPGIAYV